MLLIYNIGHCDLGDRMKYKNMKSGIFISRPNRFIALVLIDGKEEVCHVKNTGRCKELLIPGTTVFLEEHDNKNRKTKFSLIGVMKGNRLINMDSQAPNKVVYEWIKSGKLFNNVTLLKSEKTFGNSRFDLYVETEDKKIYIEVKGVTLEEDNIVRFPDAPTIRGIKHIYELIECKKQGFEAYIVFVIQMKDVAYFEPNDRTQKEFGEALRTAQANGVTIIAYDSIIEEDSIVLHKEVKVKL